MLSPKAAGGGGPGFGLSDRRTQVCGWCGGGRCHARRVRLNRHSDHRTWHTADSPAVGQKSASGVAWPGRHEGRRPRGSACGTCRRRGALGNVGLSDTDPPVRWRGPRCSVRWWTAFRAVGESALRTVGRSEVRTDPDGSHQEVPAAENGVRTRPDPVLLHHHHRHPHLHSPGQLHR